MIITCPHCQTRYQVAFEAIGSAGRKVQCAHCQKAWAQKPLDADALSDVSPMESSLNEDALDEAMASEELRVATALAEKTATATERVRNAGKEPAKPDPALMRKQQRAFTRRQSLMVAQLPLARLRRGARIVGAVALVALAGSSYFGRVKLVEQFPAMAGVYAAVGLPVNVIGLEFERLTTLQSLREGKDVLSVSAQIVGIEKQPVAVPAVVVTLLDARGNGIYEWSVTPDVHDLMAGERATFETQLPLPPGDASSVRLSFAGGGSTRGGAPIQSASAEEH